LFLWRSGVKQFIIFESINAKEEADGRQVPTGSFSFINTSFTTRENTGKCSTNGVPYFSKLQTDNKVNKDSITKYLPRQLRQNGAIKWFLLRFAAMLF
jgi:hypothetical protein